MKRTLTALVALTAVASLATVNNAGAATDVVNTDDNLTNVKLAGSDTTYFVMGALAKTYMESDGCLLNPARIIQLPTSTTTSTTIPQQSQCQGATPVEGPSGALQASYVKTKNYDHDTITNLFPLGSGSGRTQLCAQLNVTDPLRSPGLQYIDIARSSAAGASSFQCTGNNGAPASAVGARVLRFIAFAKDAIDWVHWTTGTGGGDAVTDLTVQNLKDIFVNCTITNWNQVPGGINKPIVVFSIQSASGSRAVWDSFMGGNTTTCIPAAFKDGTIANGERVIFENTAQPVENATNDPAAADEGDSIFPFSTGIHATNSAARSNSILGLVNGLTPTEANIVAGTFPFARSLFNVIINSGPSPIASEATRRFALMRNWAGPADNDKLGYLCKPLNSHSKDLNDPGVGVATAGATKNHGAELDTTLRAGGFFPLTTDVTQPRCTFSDFRVDAAAQTPI